MDLIPWSRGDRYKEDVVQPDWKPAQVFGVDVQIPGVDNSKWLGMCYFVGDNLGYAPAHFDRAVTCVAALKGIV